MRKFFTLASAILLMSISVATLMTGCGQHKENTEMEDEENGDPYKYDGMDQATLFEIERT
ncbi:MAG: hypothetical protein JNM88_20340, partial [Chitinophagaceae bacterium]|nr:hypothetical protein [Chitinophagaceae bacterium]